MPAWVATQSGRKDGGTLMAGAITATNLTKKYGALTAVDGISFSIGEGECFGFLGPNGAGKTTTVRMIHCVSPITSGAITVMGQRAHIDNRSIKMMTGVVPQEITLDRDLTVYENLRVFAYFFDIPGAEAHRRIDELLAFVELEAKRDSKISDLSTGMKRRLLIARALLNKPRLIIADEPTTGLDPQARHLIWQRLRLLKRQGTTLILTTQYMEEAQQLCDRIVVMYQGRILREGVPSRLVEEEIGREVVEIRVPEEPEGEDQRLVAALAVLGEAACGHERVGDTIYFYCRDGKDVMRKAVEMNLPSVLNRPATLEDVFLKLTGRSLIE
jgi:lipooligosaccharide transport system ATP-binding protein